MWRCQPARSEPGLQEQEAYEAQAKPQLLGHTVDTVFLFVPYTDPGVSLQDPDGCPHEQLSRKLVHTEGQVDSRMPGQYILHYEVMGETRKQDVVLSRTVHVVPNSSTFLNGTYKATCSCTAMAQGVSSPSLSSGQYTAMVSSSERRDEFSLSEIKIGPLSASTRALLIGDSILMGYFSPDYHQMAYSSGSGHLLRDKERFSIRTRVIPYSSKITYDCINTYTRQLKIEEK